MFVFSRASWLLGRIIGLPNLTTLHSRLWTVKEASEKDRRDFLLSSKKGEVNDDGMVTDYGASNVRAEPKKNKKRAPANNRLFRWKKGA